MTRSLCALAAMLAALLFATGLFAQTPTGAIEGTVSDPTGAAVPGVIVTITETAAGRVISLTTNAIGRYAARSLQPGTYNIKVESPNFSTRQIEGVAVSAGSVINGDVTLEVGRTEQVVQVTAEAVQVDTSRQTVDTVITEKEIRNLPSFSRNFLDLASLAPGVVIRDGGSIDPTKSFAYRTVGVNGRSGTGTRVTIDGVDVTDETVGTTTANISQDAVAEFQLTRSSLDISTSLTSSGAISIISKSGSNDIHGNWFWDYYNQDLGARLDYNSEAAPFKRNRTGASVGGPFIKDKLFWFANWERHYQTEQSIYNSGQFPQLNISQGFPVGIRYANGRADWNISPSMRMFYRFQHSWDLSTGGSAPSPFQNIDWTNTSTVGLDVARARMTHTFRFGYVNFNNRIESQELALKFPRFNGIPFYLGVGGFAAGPNGLAPQQTYQDNFQSSYEGSFLTGRHSLRYGLSVTRIILGGFANFAGPLSVGGTYDASTIAQVAARGGNVQDPLQYPFESFSTGPNAGFFTVEPAHNLPHGGHRNTRTAWYVGDSIKASRRLTLNLGVRWQYDSGFFNNNRNVKRDPILDTWIKGASQFPVTPKNLFSPSFGFAYDPMGTGKTVIRGGFYRAYEMNIFNNLLFDEFAMLPAGIGPDFYDHTYVAGPDGTPINVDGNHPDGDYTDLVGQPIKDVIGLITQVDQALKAAYANYQFDPNKGVSAFRQALGVTFGGTVPGNQFKIPYALQFNIGVQREIRPGTVLTVDYIRNHAVGLPFFVVDYEHRRAASTLNVANAQARVNRILGGQTVDQFIAAGGTIADFGLARENIFQGLTPDYTRARFITGGFTKYQGVQASLRGTRRSLWKMKDASYIVSYALGRGEAAGAVSRVEFLAGPLDAFKWNRKETFGPNDLDFTHSLRAGALLTVPGGFRLNSIWTFRTAGAQVLTVPNLGGAISGRNGIFGTDLNGDGGNGGGAPRADVLPGVNAGQFGRAVKSFQDLNQILQSFNQNYAGHLTPAGQALADAGIFTKDQLIALGAVIPTIPLVPAGNPNPWHNLLVTDLRFDRPIKLPKREGMRITPSVDFFNLFNHSPAALYGGLGATFGSLNFDYANAAPGNQAGDLDAQRLRLNSPRKIQIGVRFDF
ncbi:MAG: TonB-dependent receptor [Acidobacteria bacterium]|nr:TonB-dependent receptor [Acidobacteriota bacterium]